MKELSRDEARRLGLPDRSPWPEYEEVVWYPLTPAQDVHSSAQFEAASAILGDGREAAA